MKVFCLISKIKKLARSLTGNAVVVGIVSLFWLLSRSGTKPSRIVYPCQRAAATTSYTFLLYPIVTFLAGLSRKTVPKVFCAVKYSNRRNSIILISLLSVSVLFSGLAAYANLMINLTGTLQERTTLVERLTSVAVIRGSRRLKGSRQTQHSSEPGASRHHQPNHCGSPN